MQNLFVVSRTLCVDVGGHKNFDDAGALPPWSGGTASRPLKPATLHMKYATV